MGQENNKKNIWGNKRLLRQCSVGSQGLVFLILGVYNMCTIMLCSLYTHIQGTPPCLRFSALERPRSLEDLHWTLVGIRYNQEVASATIRWNDRMALSGLVKDQCYHCIWRAYWLNLPFMTKVASTRNWARRRKCPIVTTRQGGCVRLLTNVLCLLTRCWHSVLIRYRHRLTEIMIK